jgi:ribosome-associated heat shock protein Hsp15
MFAWSDGRPVSALQEHAAKVPSTPAPERQRIDRWLWHARLTRTRGAAARLAGSGHVRVNGTRIDAPGRLVRAGDVVTVAFQRTVRVIKIKGFVERRGPAGTGAHLYEDLDDQPQR